MLTLIGSLAASACWLALSPLLHWLFFPPWHMGVVLAAAVPVFSQLWVAAGKSFLQGENDMRGANAAIAAEEAAFLPVYVALLPFLHGTALLMSALVGADVLVTAGIAVRLAARGFLRGWKRPDPRLGGEICRYGLRGQVGGMLSLINLRLDVVILGALVGPGTLGVYAVASKYAELLRLPGLAITYVLYPRLAVRDRAAAGRDVAALLPRAFFMTALAAVPLARRFRCCPSSTGPRSPPPWCPPAFSCSASSARGWPDWSAPTCTASAGRGRTPSPSACPWWSPSGSTWPSSRISMSSAPPSPRPPPT